MKSYFGISAIILAGSFFLKIKPIGKYMSNKSADYLQLRKDGVFVYEYRNYHLYKHSFGKWKLLSNNKILINSYVNNITAQLNASKQVSIDEGNNIKLQLKVPDGGNLANYKCALFINGNLYSITRCDSLQLQLIDLPIKAIQYKFFRELPKSKTNAIAAPLTTNVYIPETKYKNNLMFNVEFRDSYFYYKSFVNDTLKIKGNSLIMFDSDKNKWERLQKVPDTINIFSRYNNKSAELNAFEQ